MATILITEDLEEIVDIIKGAISDQQSPVVLIPREDDSIIHKSITKLLVRFGIQANRIGFRQLLLATELYLHNPMISLSKDMYPRIARRLHNSGPAGVERSIRSTIAAAWEQKKDPIWDVFPPYNAPPSNKLFIATLAEMLGGEGYR